jgi:GrpB-like predicted nucleotidyltransferase (UPF0157 family)
MRSIDDRLAVAGVSEGEPFETWCRLRAVEGRRTTIVDLYRLAARQQGIAEPHELPLSERGRLAQQGVGVLFPGFQVAVGSNRDREPVELVPYDVDWPARFEEWREQLSGALGPAALRIEHVGSTSVPGLVAKPTIDVQISVAELGDEESYVAAIEGVGVQLRSRDIEHRYFRPFRGRPREVHVHVCQAGSSWEREHLLFRDYLREHPRACDRYAAVKQEAALVWRDDRWGYTEAKSHVILGVLDDAEGWAAGLGWTLTRA